MGFHKAAVYQRGNGGSVLLVGVYIDNLIIGVKWSVQSTDEVFDMSDIGLLRFYLGIEVRQLTTPHILELGSMERLRLSRESTADTVDPTHYRQLIGSLR